MLWRHLYQQMFLSALFPPVFICTMISWGCELGYQGAGHDCASPCFLCLNCAQKIKQMYVTKILKCFTIFCIAKLHQNILFASEVFPFTQKKTPLKILVRKTKKGEWENYSPECSSFLSYRDILGRYFQFLLQTLSHFG